ncbi:diadenylate cyclase, partial [Candidatus Hakubella thermalkaliphila]
MVLRISTELERYICELGTEGRLIEMQLNELMGTVVDDHANLIRDYAVSDSPKRIKEIRDTLEQRRPKELLSLSDIADILGYPTDVNLLEYSVSSRGYRILSKVPHLPVSTRCSKMRGPAMLPSLVTCPMIIVVSPSSLASLINLRALSLTWSILPGEELASGVYIVWIESTIRRQGDSFLASSSIT